MLKSIGNIQSSMRMMRAVLITVIVSSAVFCSVVVWKSYEYAEEQRQKIYVLDEDRALTLALAQDVYQNRMAEARSHVRRFHQLFFTLAPSADAIEYNMEQASHLCDREALERYDNLKEKGFFQRMIAAGVSTEIRIDSVFVDDSVYPYSCRLYGMTSLIRSSSVTFRNLETECLLRNVTRSDDNPHGFIIERWNVLDNSDIKTVDRE